MQIIVHIQNQDPIHINADGNETLAKAIWLSGKVPPPPLCSAIGKCGQCKVLFISPAPTAHAAEHNILSQEELANGFRLACRHHINKLGENTNCIEISLPTSTIKNINIELSSAHTSNALLAVDLGTTSLHWQAINPQGQIIAKGAQINPQMGAGSDIISRLAFAMNAKGKAQLASLVIEALKDILQQLPPISEICLAANTAMSAIFLQKNIASLSHAPYSLPLQGHSVEQVKDLPPIYIPPQLAPFVGGDISAGYADLVQQDDLEFPFLFTDLGTNGEFILAHDAHKAHITSVPLGPALEGIGLSLGHMAYGAEGIVSSVHLSPKGLEPATLDSAAPQYICGTGYLSIINCLLKSGLLQKDGHFTNKENISNPLAANLHKLIEKQGNEYILRLWPHKADNMYISSTDIEEILKVKAAFSLAMQELLDAAHMSPTNLKAIYLAGAMGSHAQGEDLEGLGFIPYGMSNRLIRMGNTSLNGAKALLLEPSKRNSLHEWSKNNIHIQLAEHSNFIMKYMQHMQFSFTD